MAINIVIPDTVLNSLNDLAREVRVKFWGQLERLIDNPGYPNLRNEKLKGIDHWAFSITMNYRATYIRDAAAIVITAIGTHKKVLGS